VAAGSWGWRQAPGLRPILDDLFCIHSRCVPLGQPKGCPGAIGPKKKVLGSSVIHGWGHVRRQETFWGFFSWPVLFVIVERIAKKSKKSSFGRYLTKSRCGRGPDLIWRKNSSQCPFLPTAIVERWTSYVAQVQNRPKISKPSPPPSIPEDQEPKQNSICRLRLGGICLKMPVFNTLIHESPEEITTHSNWPIARVEQAARPRRCQPFHCLIPPGGRYGDGQHFRDQKFALTIPNHTYYSYSFSTCFLGD